MKFSITFFALIFSFLLRAESHFGIDPCILQIHTISIPGAPQAYNASFIEYEGGYLMAFRYDKYKIPLYHNKNEFFQHICLVRLNRNFKPILPWTFCKELGNHAYDPRLVRIEKEIFLIYTSPKQNSAHSCSSSHLCLTKVLSSSKGFRVDFPIFLHVPFQQDWEKNWIPFNYDNTLLMSYSIVPHKVVNYDEAFKGECSLFSQSPSKIEWPYGILRGGTPAVLDEDEYLSFFHSSKLENGYLKYYIGAFTFQKTPPFTITRISSHPLSHSDFYSSSLPSFNNNKLVLFPLGLVINKEKIFVSYGENDGAIKVMEIDKDLLYRSFIKINRDKLDE